MFDSNHYSFSVQLTDSPVRVRFAPSPTGLLHIGGLRTALYNFLLARKTNGVFVLRIEDTDQKRFVEGAESDILKSLKWAGLSYDEGPGVGGDYAPYKQSERKDRYQAYAKQLVEDGNAYYAFDTPEEIEAMRARCLEKGIESAAYGVETRGEMRNSLTLPADEVAKLLADGVPSVVRMRVPDDTDISFVDSVRGDVSFNSTQVDDQVLIKSDGLPTYHLANVVDDHEMLITHVIRGEEWLPSTPKHILLYRAFGWQPPQMAHLPLILAPTGGKLSKRNADKMGIPVSVRDYIEAGYEPEALINFLALLGWHPAEDRELFSLTELVDAFDISRVGSSGVQFSLDKLKWFNEQYLRAKSDTEIARSIAPVLQGVGVSTSEEHLVSVASLVRDRLSFASDIVSFKYLFADPNEYDAKAVSKRWKGDAPGQIVKLADTFEALETSDWTASKLHDVVETFMQAAGQGIGKIMPQLRLAVSGEAGGPDLFPMLELIGREVTVRRLRKAVATINLDRAAG